MASPNHLVVVCGHGIWQGGPCQGHDESEWLIESYKAGETPTFIEHIRAGVQALADDERALIAFSGGPTRKETPLSEGRSYANLAAANDYFGLLPSSSSSSSSHHLSPIALHPRILVEEQALDSYYNILFSLLAFWRHCDGVWPSRLTIVSHAFKKSRLVDGHCGPDALAFSSGRICFVGINPPNLPPEFGNGNKSNESQEPASSSSHTTKTAAMKDAHSVIDHWAIDPHGAGSLLAGKRRARNPWAIDQLLFANNAERQRSGLQTRILDGEFNMEVLAADSPRPWNDEVS